MKTSEFDYELPQEFIAQEPVEPRDASRLMVLDRTPRQIQHRRFSEIVDFIDPGDVLVMNTTRVIPARLAATRADTDGKMEVLLLRQIGDRQWRVLIGGKRAPAGMAIAFPNHSVAARVVEILDGAERIIEFSEPVNGYLENMGEMPLPPYIHTRLKDGERYQTVYSRQEGSAAAPTAGLHFTPALLLALREKGVKLAYCMLHIGLDTFQPVKEEQITDHKIHSEWATLTAENARIINDAKLAGGRVIATGAPEESENRCPWRPVTAFEQDTRLFIYPGYKWRAVDALITNFHLPKSTLLMMIASFAGREFILRAYEVAKQKRYRFYSFGDAMFIV
jgi:S-adenosylmethionine:tRNA ribosyltransferase-isomerase